MKIFIFCTVLFLGILFYRYYLRGLFKKPIKKQLNARDRDNQFSVKVETHKRPYVATLSSVDLERKRFLILQVLLGVHGKEYMDSLNDNDYINCLDDAIELSWNVGMEKRKDYS